MTTLSTAGWVVHDVGLATNIGGTMFGMMALEPSLSEVDDAHERDLVSQKAWNKFSWVKLASHVAFAVPWFIGRSMLTGKEVSARARALTRTKDYLIGASLITGITITFYLPRRRVWAWLAPDGRLRLVWRSDRYVNVEREFGRLLDDLVAARKPA